MDKEKTTGEKLLKAVKIDPKAFEENKNLMKKQENEYRNSLSNPLKEKYDIAKNTYHKNLEKFTNYKQLKESILDKDKEWFVNPFKHFDDLPVIINMNRLTDKELDEYIDIEGIQENAQKDIIKMLRPRLMINIIHLSFLSVLRETKIKTFEEWESFFIQETLIKSMEEHKSKIKELKPMELYKLEKDLWNFKIESDKKDDLIYSGIISKFSDSMIEIANEELKEKEIKQLEKAHTGKLNNQIKKTNKNKKHDKEMFFGGVEPDEKDKTKLTILYDYNVKLVTKIDKTQTRKGLDYIINQTMKNRRNAPICFDEISKEITENKNIISLNTVDMLKYIRPDLDPTARINLREVKEVIDTIENIKIKIGYNLSEIDPKDILEYTKPLFAFFHRTKTREIFIGYNKDILKKVFPYVYHRPSFTHLLTNQEYDLITEISDYLNMNYTKAYNNKDILTREAYPLFKKIFKIDLDKEEHPQREVEKFIKAINNINERNNNQELKLNLCFNQDNRKQYKKEFMENAYLEIKPEGIFLDHLEKLKTKNINEMQADIERKKLAKELIKNKNKKREK
jgi:hypothetical protein